MFAWALGGEPGAAGETLPCVDCITLSIDSPGGNFGKPHRDDSFDQCHDADGRPSVLTVWVPLVPVGYMQLLLLLWLPLAC